MNVNAEHLEKERHRHRLTLNAGFLTFDMNLQASSQAFCGYDLEAPPESGSGFKRLKRLDLLPLRLKTISQESFSYMAWPQIGHEEPQHLGQDKDR